MKSNRLMGWHLAAISFALSPLLYWWVSEERAGIVYASSYVECELWNIRSPSGDYKLLYLRKGDGTREVVNPQLGFVYRAEYDPDFVVWKALMKLRGADLLPTQPPPPMPPTLHR